MPTCLKVERLHIGDAVGYCLMATADIEPGEVVLSVPLTAAITSEGVDESRWSKHMAEHLLGLQAAAEASGGTARQAGAVPWLEALPRHVDLPWLYWSEAELAQLQDEDTEAEARQLAELGGKGYSGEQVAWALSLVHSRSFVMKDYHVWVPGIDMCNHTLGSNADIRCVHSPGSCQGAGAVDEVCPPEMAVRHQQEPSRFELVAGERGIAAGDEVTISYGSWPSDVFLLFFGFAPAMNPHDSAVLFYDLFELTSFKQRLVAAQLAATSGSAGGAGADDAAAWEEVAAAVQQLEALLGGPHEQFHRMVATAAGIDSRLMEAAQALLMAGRGSTTGQAMSVPEFLQQRCRQLLDSCPTSLEEDERLLQQLERAASGGAPPPLPQGVRLEQLTTAVRFRLGKKRVLHATLSALSL